MSTSVVGQRRAPALTSLTQSSVRQEDIFTPFKVGKGEGHTGGAPPKGGGLPGPRGSPTLGRLAALPAGAGLSSRDADNLRDIWLFLNRLRWRHQLHNKVTNNLVSVSDLSSIEKHQLKAAFQAIERAQQAAVMKFSGGMS